MIVFKLANGNVYPGEKCIWRTVQTATGYKLSNWEPHTNVLTSATPTANDATINAKMGYIGKSGRFVSYTEDF
jgi:hypothetical protein